MTGLRELLANDQLVRIPVTGDVTSRNLPETYGASPTVSRVATSTTSATLLSANTSRKVAIIVNEAGVVLYVKAGTTASATDYTWAVAAGATLTIDFPISTRIDGILASGAASNAQVTEIT